MATRQSPFPFLLIVAVMILCVVPQVDQPQTAFDESDAPTVQAKPVVLSLTFVRPVARPIILSNSSNGSRDELRLLVETASLAKLRHFSLLRAVLCTLRI